MLTIGKDHIAPSGAEVHVFGQEVNPETWAISRSDLLMKDPTGRDADRIAFGSVLSNDNHSGQLFDYLIANPPYGKDWKRDEDAVRADHERGPSGRFGAGLPRISDGRLLFLLHMLAHRKDPKDGGSRIAIIMNGSPLFTGDAGSGESEIRRFVLEKDLLEALIALPEQLFYNTGIATCVWVLTNRKAKARKEKVQLIDATSFWTPMRKSLGDKRREIPSDRAQQIVGLLAAFQEGEFSKIFPTTHFGFRKITVERPLRLNFQASAERRARVEDEKAFQALAVSKKKGAAGAQEQAEGRAALDAIRGILATLPGDVFKSRGGFEPKLESDDKFMRHLLQVVRNGLGDRAGTCLDPKMQIVDGKTVCVVSCQRSREPVFLKWKSMEASPEGDFYVRSGPPSSSKHGSPYRSSHRVRLVHTARPERVEGRDI